MEISDLAAKQKRIQEWRESVETANIPPQMIDQITNTIEVYSKVLIDCWKKGSCSSENEAKLNSLERELESFEESIRLSTPDTLPRYLRLRTAGS